MSYKEHAIQYLKDLAKSDKEKATNRWQWPANERGTAYSAASEAALAGSSESEVGSRGL